MKARKPLVYLKDEDWEKGEIGRSKGSLGSEEGENNMIIFLRKINIFL